MNSKESSHSVREDEGVRYAYYFQSSLTNGQSSIFPLSKPCTDSVRLTTAFGSDHPVVSRSGRKSNLIYTCMYI